MNESDVYRKCPACGYEYEMNYGKGYKDKNLILKGYEPFIKINCVGRAFETDKDISDDYEPREYMKVYLYGCPRCCIVHFNKD